MKIELRLVLHFFVLHDVKAIKLLEHIIRYGKVWRNKVEWQVKILMVTDVYVWCQSEYYTKKDVCWKLQMSHNFSSWGAVL